MGRSGSYKVEARSVNHKGLDIHVKMPSYLYSCEPEMKRLIKENFTRGRIEVFVSSERGENIKININKPLAKEFYDALLSLKEELSIPGDIGINILASQRDIFWHEELAIDLTSLNEALNAALSDLKKMRTEEGENLLKDITGRMQVIKEKVNLLEGRRQEFISSIKSSLSKRIADILGDRLIDESRLIQEVAILTERSDITEELVRIKSHLKYMEDMFSSGDTIGKKLDFLMQELNREVNTIGSKATSTEISPVVIELKSELEKIREQVQNLQ